MPPPAAFGGEGSEEELLLPEEQENGYNKSMKINKLFWFRRPDGFVIQFTEQDAWQPYAEYEPRWKLMGVSDGTIYKKMTVDARKALNEVSLRMAQYTRNKQEVPPSLSKQVEKANLDFNKANQAAMAAEYKAAKGHVEAPPRNTKKYMGDPTLIAEMQQGGVRSKIM